MGDADMMKKALGSGLKGSKGSEFQSGYKTALNLVYGVLAKGAGKEQLMDGLEEFFPSAERLRDASVLYS